MGQRRIARESAVQLLYQLEFDPSEVGVAIDSFWKKKRAPEETRAYSRCLVEGILSHKEEIDKALQSISQHWRVARMALVDRNILRLAAFELLYSPHIAPAIVINEAIEIAKKFSGPEAATFVNGLLDALSKKLQAGPTPPREEKNVRKDRSPQKSRTRSRTQKV